MKVLLTGLLAILLQLGLAILGWGGFAAFFSHPAFVAMIVATLLAGIAAMFSHGNLSPGGREDRSNRWVLGAFSVLAILLAYFSAYTDRHGFWTIDGDTTRWPGFVLLVGAASCGCGRCLSSVRASAGWLPFNAITNWSRPGSTATSATPAISVC